jgi:hypothetical protein
MTFTYSLTDIPTTIQRSDGTMIPTDPGNVDYAAFLEWVAEGNTPTPYKAPPPPVAPVIADSAASLLRAQATRLAAKGRTADALAATLKLIGNPP